jgi:hypothetical protein
MNATKTLRTSKWIPLAALGIALLTACGSGGTGGAGGGAGTGTGGSSAECKMGGGEAPVGPCLVALHAGTYKVTPKSGTHTRGTVTIAADGAVDYDTGLQFAIVDYEGVYDRLMCCQRISVEMNPRPDNDKTLSADARHRVDVFTTSSTPGSDVVRFEYFPNWPSEQGKVDLDATK